MTDRNEMEQFIYDRLTQPDEERSPNDPVRKGTYDPCCREHTPNRYCLLPEGHDDETQP